jgi:anti-sigma regulatory factor (Ser/Thr protein kinase)
MQGADDCLFIKLPARSENLAVVRHAVGNVAQQYGMAEPGVADLQLAVSEACSNVVIHAYRDLQMGPLEVEVTCEADEFGVAVRDCGTGFHSPALPRKDGLRLGLALISTLTSSFEVSEREGGGTEVNLSLPLLGLP